MNDKVSLSNRIVVSVCAIVLSAMVMFGFWSQPGSLLVGQEDSSDSPYHDVELLAGPEMGQGGGGG